MEAEAPTPEDRVIFLGDYFDSFAPDCSAKRVCRTMAHLMHEGRLGRGPACTFLVGNHDLQYLALCRTHRHRPTAIPREPWAVPFGCSGFSKSRAQDVIRYADPEWLDALQVVTTAGGYLLSHAGVDPAFFRVLPHWDEDRMLRQLEKDAAQALATAHIDRDQAWFWCGRDRGGSDPFSGPLWQDWGTFEDDLPWPQIVGHTAGGEPRQAGRSWCLDTGQRHYGVLMGGELVIREA